MEADACDNRVTRAGEISLDYSTQRCTFANARSAGSNSGSGSAATTGGIATIGDSPDDIRIPKR